MICPLCSSDKYIVVGRVNLSELKNGWLKSFGFDPFPDDYVHKVIEKKCCASCFLQYFYPPCYGDGDFYSRLSGNAWYYEKDKWEYDVAVDVVLKVSPNSLLEIGCGNGFFLDKISSLAIDAEGIDINASAVATCTEKGLRVEMRNLSTITNTYDAIVLFEVLEHMDNVRELFSLITSRLLNPDGYLIIAVPNPDGYLKEMEINLLDMPPHHNSSWTLKCFDKLSALHGLTLISYHKEPLRHNHYSGYVQNLLRKTSKLSPQSWKMRCFYWIQSLIIGLLAPLSYLRDREKIDGQTHLVVFKNDRTA
jgi:2-polyprenyl-3-methyl-5-hydroxy-6-metoxy-1,4-benzoquinol methylase